MSGRELVLTPFKRLIGERNYLSLRRRVLRGQDKFLRLRGSFKRRLLERARRSATPKHRGIARSEHAKALSHPLRDTPQEISDKNFLTVTSILEASEIDWFLVSGLDPRKRVVAVSKSDKSRFAKALSAPALLDMYVSVPEAQAVGEVLASQVAKLEWFMDHDVWTFGRSYYARNSNLIVGLEVGCDVEFWEYKDEIGERWAVAPRENRAAKYLGEAQLGRTSTEISSHKVPTLSVFKKRMLDDVYFPIDVVYTWVDGDDPSWQEQRNKATAALTGLEYHGEAQHEARFRSRDELRYSLRSLEMFVPWVRSVYLVTSGQVPDWLNLEHPKLKLVTHADIYDDPSHLPTFNSNSIISRLHHIDGLSEHYIYINDDVFFGRYVPPERFFFPNGIARVSVSNNRRPFGETSASDQPHINLTRNIRDLLETECGITVSRAIKHTPHPQIRSVHFEMEERFIDVYRKTWASKFRHHDDIVSDQLFHYYSQATGRSVSSGLRYNYLNILDDSYAGTMWATLSQRNVDAFCLNDAPVPGATPIPDADVTKFLEAYFPLKSSFEK